MKIILDREKCIGCGSCAVICPAFFDMAEDGKSKLKGKVIRPKKNIEELIISSIQCSQEACEACPSQAICVNK
jgi:ferredoxin